MYNRFLKMAICYGYVAAYLLTKIETRSLTNDDLELAKKYCDTTSSTMVKILAGNLQYESDLNFFMREGPQGIAFDLKMDPKQTVAYIENLGYQMSKNPWEEVQK